MPELALNVVFRHRLRCISGRIEGCLGSKVTLLKMMGSFLELLERINTTFLKAELAGANEASRTVPVVCRDAFNRGIKTVAMVAGITAVAEQDVRRVIVGATGPHIAVLVSIDIREIRKQTHTSPGRSSAPRIRGKVRPGV